MRLVILRPRRGKYRRKDPAQGSRPCLPAELSGLKSRGSGEQGLSYNALLCAQVLESGEGYGQEKAESRTQQANDLSTELVETSALKSEVKGQRSKVKGQKFRDEPSMVRFMELALARFRRGCCSDF